MNAPVRSEVLFIAFVVVLLGYIPTYYIGYGACNTDHAALALDVQQVNENHSRLLQQQAAKQAELTRQARTNEQERIDAIKTIDHQSAEIKRLEHRLAQFVAEERERISQAGKDKDPIPGRYHVFDADVTERVWDEAVRGSGQPESVPSGTIQTRFPAIAISPRNAGACRTEWRRLECTNKNQCWCLFRLQDRVQRAVAVM